MKNFQYNRVLLAVVFVGFLAAMAVNIMRYTAEKQNMTVDLAIDYEALTELSEREGLPLEEVMRQAKEAGITSLAVYEATFKKLNVSGKATPGGALLERYQSGSLTSPGWRSLVERGEIVGTEVYVTGSDAAVFREVKEDLRQRLGEERVRSFTVDGREALAVKADEAPGKAFGGRREQGEVQSRALGFLIHAAAHMADDGETERLRLFGFAMVLADERFEAFGEADEAHGKGSVLQNFGDFVVGADFLGVDPDALSHEERIVASLLGALNLEAVQELADDKLREAVQLAVEYIEVALGEKRKARQVDARKREVAAAAGDFALGIEDIAHDARAAAHVGDLGVVVSLFVVLEVEGSVEEAEIREETFGGRLHGEAEEVVVRIALVVVHAFLDFENLHGEDRRFAVAEPFLCRQQEIFHDHASLGRGVRAVVDGAEGHLCACTRVHRIEVVHQGFHCLEGRAVRRVEGCAVGIGVGARREFFRYRLEAQLPLVGRQEVDERVTVDVGIADRDAQRLERNISSGPIQASGQSIVNIDRFGLNRQSFFDDLPSLQLFIIRNQFQNSQRRNHPQIMRPQHMDQPLRQFRKVII